MQNIVHQKCPQIYWEEIVVLNYWWWTIVVLGACNFGTEVLGNDHQDEECEFTVKDDGYKDTFQVQLRKKWQEK